MGAAAETIQFNTRIERSLKLAGDDVLKRAGYSPSQAVRALWRKAAGCGENPSAIVNLLEDRPLPARANARIESPSQLEALRRGREEAARAFADMGFGSEMPSSVAFDPYDQLMEEFILERHGDTNVWLDNYLGFRPNHRASCEFLDEAVERGATLCHVATTAKDVHFFTCSTLKKAAREKGEAVDEAFALAANRLAWANLANMNEVSTLVGLDLSDFWVASKLSAFNGDIEDNLIMACAERAKADYIVTRDKGLLRRSTVCALAPEDATALLRARS